MTSDSSTRYRLKFIALLALVFVAGCNVTPTAAPTERAADADRPATTITVFLAEDDTRETVSERFGGEILVWHGPADVTSEPTETGSDYQPFAVLTAAEGNAALQVAAACPEQPLPGDHCVEQNVPGLLAGALTQHIWGAGRSNRFDTVGIEGRSTV